MGNRFKQFSGCYTCRVCGKRTRETGHDEASCEMCAFCYIESGLENGHYDGCHDNETIDACPECNSHRASQIKALCEANGVQPPKEAKPEEREKTYLQKLYHGEIYEIKPYKG